MPSQSLKTAQILSQKQVMSQQLIQSIKLMSMNEADLLSNISEEVEKNPALEVVREPHPVNERQLPLRTNSEYFELPVRNRTEEDSDRKQSFLEEAVSSHKSLYDYLKEQLGFLKLRKELYRLCEKIIGNLDENGFHREAPALLASSEELEKALEIVRSLDPVGCACADWQESLLVQAGIRGGAPDGFAPFVRGLFPEAVQSGRKKQRLNEANTQLCEAYIRGLNPFPGRAYSREEVHYIVPELEVTEIDNDFVLKLNDEILPVLRVDPEFEGLKEKKDRITRRFISAYTRDARYFINSLAQRENTLLKVATVIVDFQRDFFARGPKFLKPLTMNDVAREIEMHEATVSRITSNKYIHTDWGLFELKYFFTNSISGTGSSGSHISKVSAKEEIKEILAELSGDKKIPDQKISDLLLKKGIKLARRTVAKYRKELDLPSIYGR